MTYMTAMEMIIKNFYVRNLKAIVVNISDSLLNSTRIIQAAHIQRAILKCNIAHELKNTGINTKHI
jgi:hypothetical protein